MLIIRPSRARRLGGTAWFNRTNFNSPVRGNYAWMGILHETGHALGLKHGHEFPLAISADHDSARIFGDDLPLLSGRIGRRAAIPTRPSAIRRR